MTTRDLEDVARADAERWNAVPVAPMNGEQWVWLLVKNDIGVQRASYDLIELAKG